MISKQVEFLVKLRDSLAMAAEATNEYIDSLAPAGMKEKPPVIAVTETTFSILKFEAQEGTKLGSFEVAYKANNVEEKWTQSFKILKDANATIQERYHGKDYQFNYWLYGEGKIYRQKLKGANATQ
jgi:hypothetical protein